MPRRARASQGYTDCPIVLRQTAAQPIAAPHADATYFRNSVLACYSVDGIAHTITLALLNSELFAWLHHRRNRDARQRRFPQVKVGHLAALPKPPLDALGPSERAARLHEVEGCVAEIMTLSAVANAAHDEWAQLYTRLNDLIYRLYGASPQQASAIRSAQPRLN